ncbi:phenylacetic acid catabolism protein [Bacillus salipaludis]|uniref:Phenylacetic acid catabolic protein n=1 Tax=Bacillus salipaludis TaxID=2547811 RepID=A0A4R5VU84_9BACI|nr:Phenylacetic acid catabolic protein [Bacillus salipaludis]MDQ6600160.1 Phenylacetic acid catabolic protein [Bacillus salipaludis]TDK62380.1 phenylacetic acid catabolism protein [Bacillus salipaludis]
MKNQNLVSLVEVAETIADNKFILGDRLVEIGISGPNLEATLSSIAMAQAELGHARLMYKWANELQGLNGTKIEVRGQTGKAFPSVVNTTNWIGLIAGLYAVNVAVDLVMKAVINTNHPKVNTPFSKMLKEQEEHLLYSKSWCKQLLNDTGAVPKTFRQELEKVTVEVGQWLRTVENDELLISEKIFRENSNLIALYKETIEKLISLGDVQHV